MLLSHAVTPQLLFALLVESFANKVVVQTTIMVCEQRHIPWLCRKKKLRTLICCCLCVSHGLLLLSLLVLIDSFVHRSKSSTAQTRLSLLPSCVQDKAISITGQQPRRQMTTVDRGKRCRPEAYTRNAGNHSTSHPAIQNKKRTAHH